MTELALNRRQYLELEKLGLGVFRPLEGFMTEAQFYGAVEDMHLPCGAVFPLPVVLDIGEDDAARLRGADRVALTHRGIAVGALDVESVFTCDKEHVAALVYGTTERGHPGVCHFIAGGAWFVGGAVSLSARVPDELSTHELTPEDAKATFAERGWKTVVGFQTRNVPHRAHEYLLRVALEVADGLFVQPLLGRKKVGDFTPDAILTGYRTLIGGFLPADRLVLGILSTSMRYAGPREAVFHAIIRRNYGCTHFIVGRDHAGFGDYYGKYDAHRLIAEVESDLGIAILRLSGPFYCRACDGIVTERTCAHWCSSPEQVAEISGTDMRAILLDGREPDPHLMRPEVVAALRGRDLFIEEDSE